MYCTCTVQNERTFDTINSLMREFSAVYSSLVASQSESRSKMNNGLSIRSLMLDEGRVRSGHWLIVVTDGITDSQGTRKTPR